MEGFKGSNGFRGFNGFKGFTEKSVVPLKP